MVLEISSESQFNTEISGPGLVVVDFFTTWCGPCKAIAPFVEQLASKYPDVKFIKVDTEKNPFAGSLGIRSIPTFHFYIRGSKVDEMGGANPSGLEQKVLQHRVEPVNSFAGKGVTLGSAAPAWDGIGLPPGDNARAARLKAFGAMDQKSSSSSSSSTLTPALSSDEKAIPMEVSADEDEILARAIALSQSEANDQDAADDAAAAEALALEMATAEGDQTWGEDMVPVPVDETMLGELLSMGFAEVRARKGLVHGKSVENALVWIDEHQDDADIDQPYMVRKADIRVPLTKEEMVAKQAELKALIVKRRQAKQLEEKAREIASEKERRERGQKLGETQEERDRMQRKREAEKAKREKDMEKKERDRLRAEIARDKEIRRANKGVLPSVLGVDGYNPSIVNYNDNTAVPTDSSLSASTEQKKSEPAIKQSVSTSTKKSTSAPLSSSALVDTRSPDEQAEAFIETISRYRTGGDGGNALKLLITFVKNVVENPEESKYRSINTESAAFKSKLANLVGPASLLKLLGFTKDEDGKLKLDDFDYDFMAGVLEKLNKAERTYRLMNP